MQRLTREQADYIIDRLTKMYRMDLVTRTANWIAEEIDAHFDATPSDMFPEVFELFDEAEAAFRRGDALDALTAIERAVFPKWQREADSEFDYHQHMFDQDVIGVRVYGVAA